jgi:signal transduction histidine kinase
MVNDARSEHADLTGELVSRRHEDAEREHLLAQMRAANERLVLAALAAEELAEAAEVACAAARYNERRFRALAATVTTVFWEADPAGNITVDREAWLRLTGAPFDASVPKLGWLQAVHADERAAAGSAWASAVASGEPYAGQHRLSTGGGDAWITVRAVPSVVDGVLRDWIGTLTDVTDRVRIEDAKERFIGVLGHELREPLTAISLGAEVFGGLPEPYNRVSQFMVRSAQRMDVLIHDMMELTRARPRGGISIRPRHCDLGVLALEAAEALRQTHPTRDLVCDVYGSLGAICDSTRASQVFSHLLGNAITHGADPIRMMVIGEGDDIFITVRNHGAPIPSAVIPTLFEPFSRRGQTATSSSPHEGLGVGLYLVHEIVAAHRGSIALSSSHEHGTEIAVRWPRWEHGPTP